MIASAVLDAMIASGCSPEQIVAAVKASNAVDEAKAEVARERDRANKALRLPDREWLPLMGRVLMRDGYQCTYCSTTSAPLTADHVVPVTRGGSNDASNLVACCVPCNLSKGNRLVSEWSGRK